MLRLFIALPVERAVQQQIGLITSELRNKGGKLRWVRSKLIHLTVRFLGDTDEARVDDLSAMLDSVAANYNPVPAKIDRFDGFPSLAKPRVIWMGIDADLDILGKLANEVEQGVRSLGFEPEEKKFQPHLTIGRARDPRPLGTLPEYMKHMQFEPMKLTFDRLTLYKSKLTPEGPIYGRLHESPLGPTDRMSG